MPRTAWLLAAALLGAGLAIGCSSDLDRTTRPHLDATTLADENARPTDELNKKDFYPLQIGNRWSYIAHARISLVDNHGTEQIVEEGFAYHRQLICTEEILGRSYIVEVLVARSQTFGSTSFVRYRQDHAGLYEADVSTDTQPVCAPAIAADLALAASASRKPFESSLAQVRDRAKRAVFENVARQLATRLAASGWPMTAPSSDEIITRRRGGVRPFEITRLKYPLKKKQEWVVRADPLFYSWVEGNERLDLPAGRFKGIRVRTQSELFGPHDRAADWYSDEGPLQHFEHFEGDAVDTEGNVIGRVTGEVSIRLTDLDLVGR